MKNIIFLVCLFFGLQLVAEPLKIHLISGAREYSAKESMNLYKVELEKTFGAKVTHTATKDKSKELPGLSALKEADLLIVFSRRLDVQKDDLKLIKDFLKSGKPIIGIRTASHAFQTFLELDKKYFGGSYKGHDKDFETTMSVNSKNKDHAILKGIDFSGWKRRDKPYYNNSNAADTVLLINGSANKKTHPMAWARMKGSQKIFYTSIGLAHDFKDSRFITLLNNAVKWATSK